MRFSLSGSADGKIGNRGVAAPSEFEIKSGLGHGTADLRLNLSPPQVAPFLVLPTGIWSQIRTKLRDWAIWQAKCSCYSQAASALSSNDFKTLY